MSIKSGCATTIGVMLALVLVPCGIIGLAWLAVQVGYVDDPRRPAPQVRQVEQRQVPQVPADEPAADDGGVSPEVEQWANFHLESAKQSLRQGDKQMGRWILQQIIKQQPNCKAAKEARKLLGRSD